MINQPIFQIIIDTIPNPVIIMNGSELMKCNKNFLSFFNYRNFEDFQDNCSDISTLFVQDNKHFSLDSIDQNTLWTDYIYNDNKEHIVSILSHNGELKFFEH